MFQKNNQALTNDLNRSLRQIATGKITDRYGDLGPDAAQAIKSRAEISRRETYTRISQDFVSRQKTADAASQAIEARLTDITAKTLGSLTPGSTVDISHEAKLAFDEIVSLLNTASGDTHVFGGSDPNNPPIRSEEAAAFLNEAGIRMARDGASAYRSLSSIPAFETMLNPAALGRVPETRIDDHVAVRPYMAGARPEVAAVLRGLAALAGTSGSSASQTATADNQGAERAAIIKLADKDIRAGLSVIRTSAALDASTTMRVEGAIDRHGTFIAAEKIRLSRTEDVDMAGAIATLESVRQRRELLWKVFSETSRLSLMKFLD